MFGRALRSIVSLTIGVVIAALVLQTWLVLGWVVPVTVSGSSMAPALMGPHRMYGCSDCRREFAVGLDQLRGGDAAVCPGCGRRRATAVVGSERRGERMSVDRTAHYWRGPRRWELVVFRCPHDAGQLCLKRVVGLPGETIALDGGDVVVDGQIARKSLAQQRAVRQPVYVERGGNVVRPIRIGEALIGAPPRWQSAGAGELTYRHLDDHPITDEFSYNQSVTPPVNPVPDIMLTFVTRLSGTGALKLSARNPFGRCVIAVDFGRREIVLHINDRVATTLPLRTKIALGNDEAEWTFSLFDRQVLLAIGDEVVLCEKWERGQLSTAAPDPPLALGVRDLSGEIRTLAVWRDVYYAVRHADGRQPGVSRGVSPSWLLGADQYFVLGDNAAISDDSRSWLSGAGLDAKLLVGKPLGER